MSNADVWWHDAVIYQIWPRSFSDSNGDGIGDIGGVIDRLDYLNDGIGGGLGVDAIWLSPFFASPLADYGYDIADYTAIDPTQGTMSQFDRLVEEAHARSMRVLLDLVPNHTSDQHPWFVDSRSSRDSKYRDWYVWRDPRPGGLPPNNWRSAFPSVGPAWTFDEATGQFYLHSYSPRQPDLNWENPDVRKAICDVMRFWLDRGADGFRIDVVHRIAKDPELRDNPPDGLEPEPISQGRHDADWISIPSRLAALRQVADSYHQALLVGEVYILDQARLVDYIGPNKLHLAHNFVFLGQPWSSEELAGVTDEFESLVPPESQGAWAFNNHDHSRVVTRFGQDGESKARAAAMVLLSLRGTAFIYQGEELGLPDTPIPTAHAVDIDGRDGCRTPLPWSPPEVAGPGAGFTSGVPWLPMGDVADRLNVETQAQDPTSMLNHYRGLIALRKQHPALGRGDYRIVHVDSSLWAFERATETEKILVVTNFGAAPTALPQSVAHGSADTIVASSVSDPDPHELGPYECRWVQRVPQKTS
jgi:alpha-glucosidase